MIIKVHNAPSTTLKNLVVDGVKYAADYFFDKRVLGCLEITLRFDKDLLKRSGEFANCGHIDPGPRPRDFEIDIDKNLGTLLTMLCVFHEMVHVKQYAKNELYDSARDSRLQRWKGEWIQEDKYFDKPWEIEAHGREGGLFVGWLKQTDLLSKAQKNKLTTKLNYGISAKQSGAEASF